MKFEMNKQTIITALLAAALALTACSTQKEEAPQPLDDVMMQAFYWDVPVDEQAKNGSWWDHLREMAPELKAAGISSLWTPVPAKGNWGIVDSGYGIYDHYDLGNYDQKGTVETRYGSRASEAESIKGMNELLYQEAARNKRALNYQRTAADPRACKHRNHQL